MRVDLRGLDVVRFKATLGGDYPLGPEGKRRKLLAIREPEKKASARFLTIIEPHEGTPVVKSATPRAPTPFVSNSRRPRAGNRIREFRGFGKDIGVAITETKPGATPRTESTVAADHP